MRIALVNTFRPTAGSGDGITEVTYRVSEVLKRKHKVDLIYPLDSVKRNDVLGLIDANTLFKLKVRKLLSSNYDIIHITNQEMGYVARMAKQSGTTAKVVTSIFDFMRVRKGFHKGFVHSIYNRLVSQSIRDSIDYSDLIIFSASSIKREAAEIYGPIRKSKVIYIGPPKESFRTAPIPRRKRGKVLNVGYMGALSHWKNVIFILRTAALLKARKSAYRFTIFGSGAELESLKDYKEKNGLDNVHFMGFAPENGLMGIYDSFDVFFYPTLEEGTSLPVFDAQARGLPVVLYGKTKLADEVKAHCLIAKDEEDAAKILERLCKDGYSPRERAISTKYARSFSWDRVARETLDAYRSLIR